MQGTWPAVSTTAAAWEHQRGLGELQRAMGVQILPAAQVVVFFECWGGGDGHGAATGGEPWASDSSSSGARSRQTHGAGAQQGGCVLASRASRVT